MELIRAFIAIELPADVREEVSRLSARWRRAPGSVRWVAPANLHLTLVFLGENPSEFMTRVKEVLPCAASQVTAFTWSLQDVGAFPNPRAPRVIWLGISRGAAEMKGLATAIQQQLATVGYMPGSRAFSPHLTIGRVRGPFADADRLLATRYTSRPLSADRFILFQSFLRPGGPVYAPLATYSLAAASSA